MNAAPRIVGNHALFAIQGASFTVPSAGTVSATAKPGASDTSWLNLGNLTECSIDTQSQEYEQWGPAPGKNVLKNVIETKFDTRVSLKGDELQPLIYQLLFKTLPLTSSSGQYNPHEGKTVRGWLKVQQYDQDNTLINTVDVWVHLKLNGAVPFGDTAVTFDLQGRVLFSTLNTGELLAS